MAYQPQEGVDYIVDLYAIAEVPRDAAHEELRHALRRQFMQWHSDRFQGLAPKVQAESERMGRLLTRANAILLDADKRAEYDGMLSEWDGLISNDGRPIIRLQDAMRAEAAQRTPEELEADFTKRATEVSAMVKANPKQRELLGRMLEAADEDDPDTAMLRDAYDAALFAEDQVLAIDEAGRSEVLSLPGRLEDHRFETTLGYARTVHAALEGARAAVIETQQRRELGGFATRLALLAGESSEPQTGTEIIASTGELPAYYDDQVQRVIEIASQREALLEKRLDIFRPRYPIAEAQTTAHPNFAIGITRSPDGNHDDPASVWIGFNFDAATATLQNIEVPGDIEALLRGGKFTEAYDRGYNILTFAVKDHIDLNTLLAEAYNKHLNKYFPGAL